MGSELTKTEKEVLFLLTDQYLTERQIANLRNTTARAVRHIVKKLKDKGVLKGNNKNIPNFQSGKASYIKGIGSKLLRLHGQEFNIRILHRTNRYNEIIKNANILQIDGNTIRLYKNTIEIYGKASFTGNDINGITQESLDYYGKILTRLENDLDIILIKPRVQNIRQVKAHYAEIDNELAKEREFNNKIKISATDDGKLWLIVDNSYNLHELEAIHPKSSKQDIEKLTGFFNDIRDNKPVTLTQILGILKEQAEINKETAAGLAAIAKVSVKKKPLYNTDTIDKSKLTGYG